jgi:hypothetical protein
MYGGLYRFEPDARAAARPLAERLRGVPLGAPYVLSLLKPDREFDLDDTELRAAVDFLTGGTATLPTAASYCVLAGEVGQAPVLLQTANRPFRTLARLEGLRLDIRMESWLPTDTIRRAGFGHVTLGRRHLLTLERGVSVIVLNGKGRAVAVEYASGLLAPIRRFLLRPADAADVTAR